MEKGHSWTRVENRDLRELRVYGKRTLLDTGREQRSQRAPGVERRTLLDTVREQRSQRAPGVWKEGHSWTQVENKDLIELRVYGKKDILGHR